MLLEDIPRLWLRTPVLNHENRIVPLSAVYPESRSACASPLTTALFIYFTTKSIALPNILEMALEYDVHGASLENALTVQFALSQEHLAKLRIVFYRCYEAMAGKQLSPLPFYCIGNPIPCREIVSA